MSSFLKAFIDVLIKFNGELIDLFPEEKDFKTGKHAMEIIKKTNPRLILNISKPFIILWKDKIINKDDTFFMNKNYDDEVEGDTHILMLINNLKGKWPILNDHNKDAIWKYLKTLCVLAERC
jgi:hypothetical protein